MKVLKLEESKRAEVLGKIHTVFKRRKRPTTTHIHHIKLVFTNKQ
ncbi:hypothetical protein [Aquimarina sp. TRL1]|nr:hypothetical protein [Aquimarina sp. TRL1]